MQDGARVGARGGVRVLMYVDLFDKCKNHYKLIRVAEKRQRQEKLNKLKYAYVFVPNISVLNSFLRPHILVHFVLHEITRKKERKGKIEKKRKEKRN